MRAAWLACLVIAVVAPRRVRADEPAPPNEPIPPTTEPAPPEEAPPPPGDGPVLQPHFRSKEIVVEVPGERTRMNKLTLLSLTAAGAIVGGIGLYYHLDSRSASNEVSADEFTGRSWTADNDALVDRADRSKTRAAIAYTAGGLLVTAAIVALIATEPKSETAVIRPGAMIAPTAGGAMLGGMWSF